MLVSKLFDKLRQFFRQLPESDLMTHQSVLTAASANLGEARNVSGARDRSLHVIKQFNFVLYLLGC